MDIENITICKDDEFLVFSIQRFSIYDGPGLRTVVFLKGCNLNCKWCQNPESKSNHIELSFDKTKCKNIGCYLGYIKLQESSKKNFKEECLKICPHGALEVIGRYMSVDTVFEEIMKDKEFFDASGGGVTLSGGEPLRQWKPMKKLLEKCKNAGINTVIETGGLFNIRILDEIIPHVDLFYYDLKGIGVREKVGADLTNRTTCNIEVMQRLKANVKFRMVIVPEENNSSESLTETAKLLSCFDINKITLLKYNPGGESKIDRIGSSQPHLRITDEEAEQALQDAINLFKNHGFIVSREDGEDEDIVGPPVYSERIRCLKESIRSSEYNICLERDLLFTKYIRSHTSKVKSLYLLHAKALAFVLKNKQVTIYPDELLVGNPTSKRIGGHLYTEYAGALGNALDFLFIDRRKVNPVIVSWKEKYDFYTKLLPYWIFNSIALQSFPSFRKLIKFVRGQQTAKIYATPLVAGVSHFVINYKRILSLGINGLIAEIQKYKTMSEDQEFYESLETILNGLGSMAANFSRHALELADQTPIDSPRHMELITISKVCDNISKFPASSFYEALQMIVFCQIALVCETNQHGIAMGRLDQVLYPYYKQDIETGKITHEDARTLIQCFSIKISEYSSVMPSIGGQLYGGLNNGQAADFGGIDPVTGLDTVNPVTYLFIEACGLGLKGPNCHARVSKHNSRGYLQAVSRILCSGSPIPSIFNDDVIIKVLRKAHPNASEEEIKDYGIVGCCEIALQGCHFADTDNSLINIVKPLEETLESKPSFNINLPWYLMLLLYLNPFVLLILLFIFLLNVRTIKIRSNSLSFYTNEFEPKTMDEVIDRYNTKLNEQLNWIIDEVQHVEKGLCNIPTLLTTAILEGPLTSGKEVNSGGAKYNSSGIQGVGLADVGNSFYAIDQAVFKHKWCTWKQLINSLRNNFEDDPLLHEKLQRLPKYGTDIDEVDEYINLVMSKFSDALGKYSNTRGGPYFAGWYSMTTHVHFGKYMGALPSGKLAGVPLANGLSPCLGTEIMGPTAALSSSAKMNLDHAGNGVIVNLKLQQSMLTGSRGIDIIYSLISGYFAKGGMQIQFNVLDNKVLIDALNHPENYRDLMVRVSGYAAYFNDLSPEMKQAIINRVSHTC